MNKQNSLYSLCVLLTHVYSETVSLIPHQCSLTSHRPLLFPRGPTGTAGETLPHRDRATGSEDQGLSERVLLRSVMWQTRLARHVSHIFSQVKMLTLIVITCKTCFLFFFQTFCLGFLFCVFFFLLSVSGSLSALVYQHSITPISLPCALRIPEKGKRKSPFAPKIKHPAFSNELYLLLKNK